MRFEPFADSPATLPCDLLAVITCTDYAEDASVLALDEHLGGLLRQSAASERFEGKPGQLLVLHTHGKIPAQRVALLGVGSRSELDAAGLRHAGARAARAAAAAVAHARDLVNEPAGNLTPSRLAAEALAVAERCGLEATVLGPNECRQLGMGMLLAVGAGSDEGVRFVHLVYRPEERPAKRIGLVGKGLTFDSGGLSLKPTDGMQHMKMDMAGAAVVLTAIGALAELRVPVEVHALIPCAENMISGRAYRLGDVLRSMDGKTVEVTNTDAEGRLVLADALAYAQRLELDEIVDFATLTGACVVALGPRIAGVMSNRPALLDRWLTAGRIVGEKMWPLPLPKHLRKLLDSDIADLKNIGGRDGGTLTAGLFLQEFVDEDTPWAHVDLAGPAWSDEGEGALSKGGTGFGVASILEYVTGQS